MDKCASCRKRVPVSGYVNCEECRAYQAKWKKENPAYNKAYKREHPFRLNPKAQAYGREYTRQRTECCLQAGYCTRCTKRPAKDGYRTCAVCQEYCKRQKSSKAPHIRP